MKEPGVCFFAFFNSSYGKFRPRPGKGGATGKKSWTQLTSKGTYQECPSG